MVVNGVLIRKFRAPLYGSLIWIVVCKNIHKAIDTVEDIISYRIASEEVKPKLDAYAFSFDDGCNKQHMIFVTHRTSPGAIAHEAKHLLNHLFSYHGVKLSLVNDEPECHYLETFVNKIHFAVNHFKKNIINKK
jgi:hypothetical protein